MNACKGYIFVNLNSRGRCIWMADYMGMRLWLLAQIAPDGFAYFTWTRDITRMSGIVSIKISIAVFVLS